MTGQKLQQVIEEQTQRVITTIQSKNAHYAKATDENALSAFYDAAAIQDNKPRQALAGMMAKHTVSIYDLIEEPELAPQEVWEEKITDHIAYLVLLRALVQEEDPEARRRAANKQVTEAIFTLMKERGFTITRLAGVMGVDKTTVGRWLRGDMLPNEKNWTRLYALGVEIK